MRDKCPDVSRWNIWIPSTWLNWHISNRQIFLFGIRFSTRKRTAYLNCRGEHFGDSDAIFDNSVNVSCTADTLCLSWDKLILLKHVEENWIFNCFSTIHLVWLTLKLDYVQNYHLQPVLLCEFNLLPSARVSMFVHNTRMEKMFYELEHWTSCTRFRSNIFFGISRTQFHSKSDCFMLIFGDFRLPR